MDIEGHSHIFTFDREDDKRLQHRVYQSIENNKFRLLSQKEQPDGNVVWVWASDYMNTSKDAFWHGREALRQQRQQDVQQAELRKKKSQGGQHNHGRPSRSNMMQQGRVHKPKHSGHKGTGRQTPSQQASNARGILQVTGGIHSGGAPAWRTSCLQPCGTTGLPRPATSPPPPCSELRSDLPEAPGYSEDKHELSKHAWTRKSTV